MKRTNRWLFLLGTLAALATFLAGANDVRADDNYARFNWYYGSECHTLSFDASMNEFYSFETANDTTNNVIYSKRIPHTIKEWKWEIQKDGSWTQFGDNSSIVQDYDVGDAESHLVKLTITSNNGTADGNHTRTMVVQAQESNLVPLAHMMMSANTTYDPTGMTLDVYDRSTVRTCGAGDGAGENGTAFILWGDGHMTLVKTTSNSTQRLARHTYDYPGKYTVRYVFRDELGNKAVDPRPQTWWLPKDADSVFDVNGTVMFKPTAENVYMLGSSVNATLDDLGRVKEKVGSGDNTTGPYSFAIYAARNSKVVFNYTASNGTAIGVNCTMPNPAPPFSTGTLVCSDSTTGKVDYRTSPNITEFYFRKAPRGKTGYPTYDAPADIYASYTKVIPNVFVYLTADSDHHQVVDMDNTDFSGYFLFRNIPALDTDDNISTEEPYYIYPVKNGYTFSPVDQQADNNGVNATNNDFNATLVW